MFSRVVQYNGTRVFIQKFSVKGNSSKDANNHTSLQCHKGRLRQEGGGSDPPCPREIEHFLSFYYYFALFRGALPPLPFLNAGFPGCHYQKSLKNRLKAKSVIT